MVIVTQWSQTMKKPLLLLLLLLFALPARAAEPHITILSPWTECSFPADGIHFYRASDTRVYAVVEVTTLEQVKQLGQQRPWEWCGIQATAFQCTLYGSQISCTIDIAKPPAVPGLKPVVLP